MGAHLVPVFPETGSRDLAADGIQAFEDAQKFGFRRVHWQRFQG
jgi:hypothetical protein